MDLPSETSFYCYTLNRSRSKSCTNRESTDIKCAKNISNGTGGSRDITIKIEPCGSDFEFEQETNNVKLELQSDDEASERERQELFHQMLLFTSTTYQVDNSHEAKEVGEGCKPKKRIKKIKTKSQVEKKEKPPVYCFKCNKTFKKMANLNRHNRSVHAQNEQSECRICLKIFKSKIHLQFHERKVHSEMYEPAQECPDCSKVFKSKAYLKRHMEEVHPENSEMVQCLKCFKNFKSHIHLNIHSRRVHSPESKKGVCSICGKIYSCKLYLRRHMEVIHTVNSSPYVCSVCTMPFFSEIYLQRHVKHEHEENQKLQCEHCSRFYQNDFKLKRHVYRVHTYRKEPVVCQICWKTYKSIETLKTHMKIIHCDGDTESTCHICGAIFKCNVYLNKHIRQVHNLYAENCLAVEKEHKGDSLGLDHNLDTEKSINNRLPVAPIDVVECKMDMDTHEDNKN